MLIPEDFSHFTNVVRKNRVDDIALLVFLAIII